MSGRQVGICFEWSGRADEKGSAQRGERIRRGRLAGEEKMEKAPDREGRKDDGGSQEVDIFVTE